MKCTAIAGLLATSLALPTANGQEAIPREYGYKLAGLTPEAAYFLSGIQRGSEPESVQAWVWTVNRAPTTDSDQHDAKAELTVLRCSGRTIEILKTELYREGALLSTEEASPMTPKEVRPNTPMDLAWGIACDMGRRYSAQTIPDIAAVYQIAR